MITYHVADIESTTLLTQLWVDSFTQAYQGIHSPENIQSYCLDNFSREAAELVLTNDKMVCTIATRNSKPVGLTIIHHHSCPLKMQVNSSELKQIYLLSSEYGSGLGKSMIENGFEIMREADHDWAWLCVSDLNYRAQKFYRKAEFNPIGEGPILEVGTDRLKSLIMIKRL